MSKSMTAQDQLRVEIRTLATAAIAPYVHRGETEGILSAELLDAMAQSGCFALTLPTEYGGRAEGVGAFTVQQEELAKVWPTAAVAATWANLSGRLIARYGSSEQKSELLPGLANGKSLGAVAFTEPHGGSDAAGIRTTAAPDGDSWVLEGAKRLIDNIANASFVIVTARTTIGTERHKGISMFVVKPGDRGFEQLHVYRTLGLRAAGVGRFSLEACRIPKDRLLGQLDHGFYQMMDMVEFGRIGVAAICVGMVEAALESAVHFVSHRQSFDRPLRDNEVILAEIADMRSRLDAARLLTERAAALVDAGVTCQKESAIAKVYASELAVEASTKALHLHGGIGFTDEAAAEMFVRDSHAFTVGEGTSEVLRMVIGRHELREHERAQ